MRKIKGEIPIGNTTCTFSCTEQYGAYQRAQKRPEFRIVVDSRGNRIISGREVYMIRIEWRRGKNPQHFSKISIK